MEKRRLISVICIFLIITLTTFISAQQKVSDKVLCESSDGKWINEECQCPSNSVGFKEGFGCDYKSSYSNQEPTDSINSDNIILIIAESSSPGEDNNSHKKECFSWNFINQLGYC